MAQEFVEELNRVVTNLSTSSAHRERVFLEGRLAEVKQDLESSEKDFSQFASKHTAINIPEQGKAMIGAAAELEGQLIAAETQLQSLREVYTDNNVRVRETQARVDELRRQLEKMGGTADAIASSTGGDAQSMYPSIRQLPVLGVNYADLYRRTKIEEAVFESLTQEYELARVQEVKETPSVKVLDPANIPGEKSFPPRTLIILGGTLLAGALAVMWVLANEKWRQIDAQDARKILASEVAETVRTRVPWRFWNGSSGNTPGIAAQDQLMMGPARNGGMTKQHVEDNGK
jgi:capsule polysaccharide export protein KpsE/RkpR